MSCITHVTFKFLSWALLVNSGWLDFSNFKVFVDFSADEHELNFNCVLIFELRSETFLHYICRGLIFKQLRIEA